MLQSLLTRWSRCWPVCVGIVVLTTCLYPAAARAAATPRQDADPSAGDHRGALQLHPAVWRNIEAAVEVALGEVADAWAAEQPYFEAWSARPVRVVALETSRQTLRLQILAQVEGQFWAPPVRTQDDPDVLMLADEAPIDAQAGARLAAQCAARGRRSSPPAGYLVHAEAVGLPQRAWTVSFGPFHYARHEQACALHLRLDPDCLRRLGDPAACGYTEQLTVLDIGQELACEEVEAHWRCRQLGGRKTPDLSGNVEATIPQKGN